MGDFVFVDFALSLLLCSSVIMSTHAFGILGEGGLLGGDGILGGEGILVGKGIHAGGILNQKFWSHRDHHSLSRTLRQETKKKVNPSFPAGEEKFKENVSEFPKQIQSEGHDEGLDNVKVGKIAGSTKTGLLGLFGNIFGGSPDPTPTPTPSPSPPPPATQPSSPSEGEIVQGRGDPHFTGADNSHFDFSGIPNRTYCLFTDSHLHINAYFGGYYGEYEGNAHKSLTWMRKVGILWGHHAVKFEAREGAEWEYGNGYMSAIEVDSEPVTLPGPGSSATFAGGAILLRWEAARQQSGDDEIDVYSIEIEGVLRMIMELRPEVSNFRTETDGTVHFDLLFPETRLSGNAHGILGQTFRPDHSDRLARQKLQYSDLLQTEVIGGDNGEGFLDGSVNDYETTDLMAPDCRLTRFSRSMGLDPETSLAMELSMEPAAVGNSGLPRKLMIGGF